MKKLFCIILALTTVFLFSGCGKDNQVSDDGVKVPTYNRLRLSPAPASGLYSLYMRCTAPQRYEFLRILDMCFALDMPDGSICCLTATRIHIISSLTEGKTYRIYDSKNIEQTLVCISTKILSLTRQNHIKIVEIC